MSAQPVVGQRDDLLDRRLRTLELQRLVRPAGAHPDVAVLERRDLVGGVVPVPLQERLLLLQQGHRGVQLVLRQFVRILDPEARLRLLQVESRVGDLDRVVRDRQLALVLAGVDGGPAGRRRLHLLRVVDQGVRAPLHRDAVVDALDRVVRGRLEGRQEVLPRRDQVDVDGLDVAAVDQPQTRVAGRRDEVVLATASAAAGAHQRHHLVRAARVLAVDDAAGLLLERLREARVAVRGPLDQVQRAFALADRRRQAAAVAARNGDCRHEQRGDERDQEQVDLAEPWPSHDVRPPCRGVLSVGSIANVCSGRHVSRTGRPRCSSASADDDSRFCCSATSSPPPSSSTM